MTQTLNPTITIIISGREDAVMAPTRPEFYSDLK